MEWDATNNQSSSPNVCEAVRLLIDLIFNNTSPANASFKFDMRGAERRETGAGGRVSRSSDAPLLQGGLVQWLT